jgi:hypothetical protein
LLFRVFDSAIFFLDEQAIKNSIVKNVSSFFIMLHNVVVYG